MSDKTRNKLEQALLYIEQHLDEKLSAEQVAQHACLSSFHFQRMFRAYLGEPVSQYVLHRRLELAAKNLISQPELGVLDIALNSGFETHSAFTRAFRQHFAISPSEFRLQPKKAKLSHDKSRPFLNTVMAKSSVLKVEIKSLPDLHYNYKTAKGTVNGTFLKQTQQDVTCDFQHLSRKPQLYGLISAFPASPQSLNDNYAQVLYGALYLDPQTDLWSPDWLQIEPGLWAVFEHKGDYDYLYQTWNQAFRAWLPSSGYELRDALPFELYITSPATTPQKDWLTHIYVPIKTAGSEQQT